MAKATRSEIVELLAGKGLDIGEDNPNLEKIAKALGVLPEVMHEAKAFRYSKDAGQVPLSEEVEGTKVYLAVTGGARGRDCWFPVPAKRTVAETAHSIMDALEELLDE